MDAQEGQQRPIAEIVNRLKIAIEDLERVTDALKDKCKIYMAVKEREVEERPPSSADAKPKYNIPLLDELDNMILRIDSVKMEIKEITTLLA